MKYTHKTRLNMLDLPGPQKSNYRLSFKQKCFILHNKEIDMLSLISWEYVGPHMSLESNMLP